MNLCSLLSIWYTLMYPKEGLLQGLTLSGHDFDGTGEIHQDHWEIECRRCGFRAGSEIDPSIEESRG